MILIVVVAWMNVEQRFEGGIVPNHISMMAVWEDHKGSSQKSEWVGVDFDFWVSHGGSEAVT